MLLKGRDDERGYFGGFGVVAVYRFGFLEGAAATGFDGEAVGPLAFDGVEDIFLLACGVEGGGEGVFLA